ncbi:alpha/beta hydrolase [Gelidibacter salicanalis]|uniref:Alpha/beta hydrolase n=1 Tax=Gelidibacter salicanalis TaxID=291193 RepID=A0A934NKH5_9FLAO|nr:alpha/beta fold hydrolase [Gelidibacter salicanalis]MBJ7880622.1 alpha/beta hydrolase [Gelidibacter salicanalis]
MKKALLLILWISTFKISGQTILEYEREINEKENYIYQDIEFENTNENIKLSGTLITPKSNFDKVIIIVSGSGKDTRYTHPKLTENFLKNNIAVYRFDERGIGKSEGEYTQKVSPLKNDLNFCIQYLRNIDVLKHKKIGVLGHSLGGIASIGVFEYAIKVDFLIQMSTHVNPGESFKNNVSRLDFFKNRDKTIEETEKIIDTFNYIIHKYDDYSKILKECEKVRKKLKFPKYISDAYLSSQFIDIIKTDTEFYYKNIKIPVLYIIGNKDEIIDAKYVVMKLEEFDNRFITVEVLENMDPYLTLNNGEWSKSNKSEIREIDNIAMDKIINWINKNN